MSWISNILGKKSIEPFNFGLLKTDMHSHLIPGIDDGAETMEDSLMMIQRFAQMGYKKIITTPHVKTGSFENTTEIIKQGEQKVKQAIEDLNINIEFEAAAEYFFDYSFNEKIDNNDLLTFSNGHILVEYSFSQPPMGDEEMFFQLQMKGLKPILAHFERYVYWHGSISKAEALRNRGVKIQVNIGSIIGHYGPQIQKQAEKLIKANCVDLISSDCHRLEHLDIFQQEATHPLFKLIDLDKLYNHHL
ncbi:MAG: capsular biosynthesis protein [Bacteroidetes bacterium]|nr:capsular biosynthesis protein [Bacteroidota bacterium]